MSPVNGRKGLWIAILTIGGGVGFSLCSIMGENLLLKAYGLLFVFQVGIASTYLLLLSGFLSGTRSKEKRRMAQVLDSQDLKL